MFKTLTCAALSLALLAGCEQRVDQTKQVIKELPSATELTKEHVQGQMDRRLEQVNRVIDDPSSTINPDAPDPTKQWVGPKPWKGSTTPGAKAPLKVHTP